MRGEGVGEEGRGNKGWGRGNKGWGRGRGMRKGMREGDEEYGGDMRREGVRVRSG